MTPCGLVESETFGGACWPHSWGSANNLEEEDSTHLRRVANCVITQKTCMFNVVGVRTSDFVKYKCLYNVSSHHLMIVSLEVWTAFRTTFLLVWVLHFRVNFFKCLASTFHRLSPLKHLSPVVTSGPQSLKQFCRLPTEGIYVRCMGLWTTKPIFSYKYIINWLIFITETEYVYCAVRAENSNISQVNFFL